MLKDIFSAFIPIFVAVDAIGVLPIFISFTSGFSKKEKSTIIINSMYTAIGIAFGFIVLGKWIFAFLGITIADFMIAGGIILFSISIIDIIASKKKRQISGKELAAVPLGVPLIVGPAVLTTSLLIIGEYGLYATLMSIVVNVLLAGLIFSLSDKVLKVIGEQGARVLSKVTSLLLAAIAVMMVRKGIVRILIDKI